MSALGGLLFFFGIPVACIGGVVWVVARSRARRAETAAMTDVQREWFNAEAGHRESVAFADRDRRSVAKTEQQRVQAAEAALAQAQEVGTRAVAKVGSVKLWENRVDAGGTTLSFEHGPVAARVDSVAPAQVGGKQQPGSASLTVAGAQGSATVVLPYGKLAAAQALAAQVEPVSSSWPQTVAAGQSAVQDATAALGRAQEVRANNLAAADAALAAVAADRRRVDEARAQLPTSFCPTCGANVAVSPGGQCPEGHSALQEYQPGSSTPVRVVPRIRRGTRAGQIMVAVGVAMLIAGLGIAVATAPPAQPAAPSGGQAASTPATQPAKPAQVATVAAQADPVLAAPSLAPAAEPAAAEPAPAGPAPLTDAEQSYLNQAEDISNATASALGDLSDTLTNDPAGVLLGGDSMIKAATAAGIIQASYKQAQKLHPPASLAGVHKKWLGALKDYSAAMDRLADGIDNKDTKQMEAATKLMNRGQTKLTAATAAMNEFSATHQ